MDFIVKRIWQITIPTAMAVLIFQLYWLHNTYVNQQLNFKQTATDALKKAYDAALLETMPGKDKSKTTQIIFNAETSTTIKRSELKAPKNRVLKSLLSDSSHHTSMKMDIPDVHTSRFLADVMSMASMVDVDPSELNKKYREELENRGILLPFKLTINKKKQDTANANNTTSIQFKTPGKEETITAQFTGLNKLLIFEMIWPIVLSFLLVILITSCIWVLWRIIYQQKKLQVMKNDFIANISHELKTPLSILNTTNDVLLNFEGMKDPEKTERYLKLAKTELNKLENLIDGILALTKMEYADNQLGPFEKVNLEDLLKAVASRFKELPGVNIQLDLKINEKEIKSWPEALKTVISNLLDNAIKYTYTPDKYIKITVTEDPKFYWLSVIDHGIGIAKYQQPFIFDKFYRVPQGNVHEVRGYGLGLCHVKSLLEKIEAKISVSSKLTEGSVFTIQLKKNG